MASVAADLPSLRAVRPRGSFGTGRWTLQIGVAGVPADACVARVAAPIEARRTGEDDADA